MAEGTSPAWPAVAWAFLVFSLVFLFLGCVTPCAAAIWYFFFSYKKVLQELKDCELLPHQFQLDPVKNTIRKVFLELLQKSGVKDSPRFFFIKKEQKGSALYSDCGVVGKGKGLLLIVSDEFADYFRNRIMGKVELKAILLHEICHVCNRDFFLPLWLRVFSRSKSYRMTLTFLVLCFFCTFGFVVTSGDALLPWYFSGMEIFLPLGFIALLPILFFLVIFTLRAQVWTSVAEVFREREQNADDFAIKMGVRYETMISVIKKMAMLASPQLNFSVGFGTDDGEMRGLSQVSDWETPELSHQYAKDILKHDIYYYISGIREWVPSFKERLRFLETNRKGYTGRDSNLLRSLPEMLHIFAASCFIFGMVPGAFDFFGSVLGEARIMCEIGTAYTSLLYVVMILTYVIRGVRIAVAGSTRLETPPLRSVFRGVFEDTPIRRAFEMFIICIKRNVAKVLNTRVEPVKAKSKRFLLFVNSILVTFYENIYIRNFFVVLIPYAVVRVIQNNAPSLVTSFCLDKIFSLQALPIHFLVVNALSWHLLRVLLSEQRMTLGLALKFGLMREAGGTLAGLA
jgi:Zn-dependent protease with chaperone function